MKNKNVANRKTASVNKIVDSVGGFRKSANSSSISNSSTIISAAGHFYSAHLSTDFLELPQNEKEKRALIRHFAKYDEITRRALELKETIPLSKMRLSPPKIDNHEKKEFILDFYQKMCKRINLFKRIFQMTREYNMFGISYVFMEESKDVSPFEGLTEEEIELVKNSLKFKYDRRPEYPGWKDINILPPDAVEVKSFSLSSNFKVKLYPPASFANEGNTTNQADRDEEMEEIPDEIRDHLETNGSLPLDTDPDSGSHVALFRRGGAYYEETGESLLDACLRTLVHRDKLRQAQASIATRHMTPIRVIWGDKLSQAHMDDLRAQVDLALQDPDYSIIANYEINWQEMGSNDRLMDLSIEYEELTKRLMIGYGFTMEMLMGEGTYAGNQLNTVILNNEFLNFRQDLKDFVETHMFSPVAKKKGFYEIDKFGDKKYIYPDLTFSRLALMDTDQTFANMLDLYSKGAIPISYILELYNIDPHEAMEEVKKDMFTVRDATFNDFLRDTNAGMAQSVLNQTNLLDYFLDHSLKHMNLEKQEAPAAEEGLPDLANRFGSQQDN